MRRFLLATVVACLTLLPSPLRAWGIDIHRTIAERAIALLPAELRPFYEKHKTFVVEHSIDPDLWRTAGFEEEPPRHFVDLDAYGPYPFTALPRDYDAAVAKFGAEFVRKNGTLPWRTQEIYDQLVKAFAGAAQPDPGYRLGDVRFFSSVISHYVSDAHVPFHGALNYDGQLTGQWGIHSRFESQLAMRELPSLTLNPQPRAPVRQARDFVFDTLTSGFPLVEKILAVDRRAVRGRDEYDDRYFAQFSAGTRPILEQRLSAAVSGVAAVITGAWEAAGRPRVPVDPPRAIRKVRRP
jgi:Zinc dependent phospholipase C